MADVFISYSSADKAAADMVCAGLESAGISCWIAPRDIVAGNYPAAIVKAIRACKVLVLILSSHSNTSPQVEHEIERAGSLDKVIYPLRIEQVLPSENLELFISSEQWMDAFEPPLETHLAKFASNVKQLLSQPVSAATPVTPSKKTDAEAAIPSEPSTFGIWNFVATVLWILSGGVVVRTLYVLDVGGANVISVTGIGILSLLVLSVAATFLPAGRKRLEELLSKARINRKLQGAFRVWWLAAVLVLTFGLSLLLPDVVARYLNRKGDKEFSAQQFAAAALDYQNAVNLKPSLAGVRPKLSSAHFNVAVGYDKAHDYPRAIIEYEACLDADDKNYAAHNNLARLLILERKDYNGALRHLTSLEQNLAKLPVDIQYYLYKNLGWANLELHNYTQAEQQLTWALIKHNGAAAHFLLGRVLTELHRDAEAKQHWDQFIELIQHDFNATEEVEPDWIAYAQEKLHER